MFFSKKRPEEGVFHRISVHGGKKLKKDGARSILGCILLADGSFHGDGKHGEEFFKVREFSSKLSCDQV
jgi:hypothetical protein